jgi:hypothetical protein
MAVYLDEEFVGSDPNEIIYPRLLLCMSVTCLMSDGRLFGAHIGEATYEDAVLAGLKSRIAAQPSKPVTLYIIGDQAKQQSHGGKSPQAKAQALGYRGPVRVYDTGKLSPTDGSFVRIVSNGGAAACSVYATKDENARPYTIAAGAAKNVQMYQPPPRNAFQNTAVYKTGHTTNTPVAALTDHDFVSLIV